MNKPLEFRPTLLGFCFRDGKSQAMIVDEDMCKIHYQIGDRVRWMNKPIFFDRIGKDKNGDHYLGTPLRKK